MKKLILATVVTCVATATGLNADTSSRLSGKLLQGHELPAGPAAKVLPQGAILHVQFSDLLKTVEGLEQIVVAAVPEKALPPDQRQLLQMDHPLLTVIGMQHLQEPISQESVSRKLGLNPRGALGVTLYPGDPRRLFIVSLPIGEVEALAGTLNALLQPTAVEEASLNGQRAVRIVPGKIPVLPELFLVCSEDTAFVCGDRGLAQALFNMPSSQRLANDPFVGRVLPEVAGKRVAVILNPALLKPMVRQFQQVRAFALPMLSMQKHQLLAQIPKEAREQIELRVQTELGVEDLDQFADYVECLVTATLEQVLDFVTNRLMAFEGICLSGDLEEGSPEINLRVYSGDCQPEAHTAAIPLDEVRQAMAWLGPDFHSFKVTGRKLVREPSPILWAWVKRVRQQFESKGLESGFFDHLAKMLAEQRPIRSLESRVDWTLTSSAPLNPNPPLQDAASLDRYFSRLEWQVYRPVVVVPGQGPDFLATCLRDEVEVLNANRQLGADFAEPFRRGQPLLDSVSRFKAEETVGDVSKLMLENAHMTRGGLFGYDQHELVNRRVYYARKVGDYLVYHRGLRNSGWLGRLDADRPSRLSPAVAKLLDRVPEGANSLEVNRVLVCLPDWLDWLSALEDRIHADTRTYLEKAQRIVDESPSLEEATKQIRKLRMPEMIAALSLDPQSGKLYGLLPGNLMFPRPKVLPVLQGLLKDFAAKADDVGGSLLYTRVQPESYEVTMVQSTEAITTLIRTFGNRLAEDYLTQPGGRGELLRKVTVPHDGGDRTVFDQVLLRNPRWAFLPMPKPRHEAKPKNAIPERDAEAGTNLIDLSEYYNAALTDEWHSGGLPSNTLSDLPRGLQEFGGVQFDARGIIQLTGQAAEQQLDVQFPKEVLGIQVGRPGDRLHFLHAAGWPSPQGTQVGSYVVHFANGETRQIPLVYGKNILDWWQQQGDALGDRMERVWTGENKAQENGPPLSVYKVTWENPLPDVHIDSIDFKSAMANSAPFLIALTVGGAAEEAAEAVQPAGDEPAPNPAGAGLIDLSAHYNGSLTETWQVGGLENNTLSDLPRGVQEFGGVRFDVRGLIQLSG